ncbi:hypothetical protein OpiT1DRAFT_03237 [Opitutaceae bacterium TAV1]|nr:hypothetical protein OpiT1DRAFT_03237 [Opitutaceae bacterium TAV1]
MRPWRLSLPEPAGGTFTESIMKTLRLLTGCLSIAVGAASLGAQPHDAMRRSPSRPSPSGSSLGISLGVGTPGGFLQVSYGKDNYYYRRGTFYQPGPQGYRIVRPPRGCIVPVLPPSYARVYVGGVFYYRYDNIYYRQVDSGYMVVDAPVVVTTTTTTRAPGVVTPATPAPAVVTTTDGTRSVWVGDVEYLFRDGQFFRRTADGLVWSEAPLGAVTRTLPKDATSVWYQDVEYFECDGIYFRKTPDGYKVIPAPWKTPA